MRRKLRIKRKRGKRIREEGGGKEEKKEKKENCIIQSSLEEHTDRLYIIYIHIYEDLLK